MLRDEVGDLDIVLRWRNIDRHIIREAFLACHCGTRLRALAAGFPAFVHIANTLAIVRACLKAMIHRRG